MRFGCALLGALWLGACSGSGNQGEPPPSRGSAVLAPAPATASKSPTGKPGKRRNATSVGPRAAVPAAVDGGVDAERPVASAELKTEEREANPHSESVTLRLSVTPSVKAVVLWGARQLAHLEPGHMEAEITRPRGSGPLDLEIKADGYLPYHTRLYADRNDKLGVRLHRSEDAPNLFGYKRSVEAQKATAEKP